MKGLNVLALLCALALAFVGCEKKERGGIRGEQVDYASGGVTLKGYLAYDAGIEGRRPGVLVVHEWWGHDEYARKRAEMLAGLGYTALAVDMYGEGKRAAHPDDAQKFSGEITRNMEAGRARFAAAMELLKKHGTVDPERIAAIGYCFGGSVVLQMARAGVEGLDGVVSFHGGLSALEPAAPGTVKAKILVCHGGEDTLVPPEQVALFREEMDRAGADYELISYAGAMHSFTNPEADRYAREFNIPLGYNAEADKRSWADMKKFLEGVLGK